jgi:deoxycytidine triphosphate deaminase
MSVLSDVDIKKELGKKILIFPFNEQKIRGSSINLSVSNKAWDINTKKTIFDLSKNSVIIPKHSTALIQTDEILHVTNHLAGTFHSKVKLVSQGLGHISTTLDPGWIGNLLIAVHNHTSEDFCLKVGETFVTLTLYYVNSKSKFNNNNKHGRQDVLVGFELTSEDSLFFDDDLRTDVITLKKKMLESDSFKKFKKNSQEGQWYKSNIALSIGIFIFLIAIYFGLDKKIHFSWAIRNTCLVAFISYFTAMINVFIMKRER